MFVGLAFGLEGFLMVLHKKHVPLDMITHELLGYTMLACALGVLLELKAPGNFLVSVFRGFAVQMQGVWLISVRSPPARLCCRACASLSGCSQRMPPCCACSG